MLLPIQIHSSPLFWLHIHIQTLASALKKKTAYLLQETSRFLRQSIMGEFTSFTTPAVCSSVKKLTWKRAYVRLKNHSGRIIFEVWIWLLTTTLENCGHSKRSRLNCGIPGHFEAIPRFGYMDSRLRSLLRLRLGLELGFETRNKFIHKVPRSKFLNPTTTLVEKETHVVYLFL